MSVIEMTEEEFRIKIKDGSRILEEIKSEYFKNKAKPSFNYWNQQFQQQPIATFFQHLQSVQKS